MWPGDGVEINTIEGTLFTIGPMLCIMIFSCKVRKFDDGFHIIQEVKWLTIIVIMGIILYPLVGVLLPSLMGFEDEPVIRSVCVTTVSVIQSIIYLYIQTLYVLRVVDKDSNLNFTRMSTPRTPNDEATLSSMIAMQEIEKRRRTMSKVGDENNTKTDNDTGNTKDTKLRLMDTLGDKELFESFMIHLGKEWSMELLLAFIELTQFQSSVKQEFGDKDEYEMKFSDLQIAVLANEDIPKSYIVFEAQGLTTIIDKYDIDIGKVDISFDDKLMEYKVKACVLYLKYVNGGDLEINISYKQKQRLNAMIVNVNTFMKKKINAGEVFNVYVDVIHELGKLLNNSHARFKANMNC